MIRINTGKLDNDETTLNNDTSTNNILLLNHLKLPSADNLEGGESESSQQDDP